MRDVVLGPDGVTASNRTTMLVDLSTTGPRMATTIAAELDKVGRITLIDAPVSGGTAGAEKGTLAVMVSGDKHVVETLHPASSVFGKVFLCGDKPGMGQTLKLANNIIAVAALAISSEAMAMGAKAGLDPQIMIETIMASSGGNVALRDKFPRGSPHRHIRFRICNRPFLQGRAALRRRSRGHGRADGGRRRRATTHGRHQRHVRIRQRLYLRGAGRGGMGQHEDPLAKIKAASPRVLALISAALPFRWSC